MQLVKTKRSFSSRLLENFTVDRNTAVRLAVDHAEEEGDRLARHITEYLQKREKRSRINFSPIYFDSLNPLEGSRWPNSPGSLIRALCTGIAAGIGINSVNSKDKQGLAGFIEFSVAQEISIREVGPPMVGGKPYRLIEKEEIPQFVTEDPSRLIINAPCVSYNALRSVVHRDNMRPNEIACMVTGAFEPRLRPHLKKPVKPSSNPYAAFWECEDVLLENILIDVGYDLVPKLMKLVDPFWPSYLKLRWLTWE